MNKSSTECSTQRDRILAYLKSGRAVTPLMALHRFECFRLAARINELREAGYTIRSNMIRIGRKKVASYSLS